MPYLFLFTVSVFTNSKSFHSNKCDKLFIIFWCWDSNSLPFDRENLLPEPPDRLVPFDMILLIRKMCFYFLYILLINELCYCFLCLLLVVTLNTILYCDLLLSVEMICLLSMEVGKRLKVRVTLINR